MKFRVENPNPIVVIFAVLFFVFIWGLLMITFGALMVGTANSWIVRGSFVDGWHAAWDRWYITILWVLLWSWRAFLQRKSS